MSATVAPSPWPAPPSSVRVLWPQRTGVVHSPDEHPAADPVLMHWRMGRNCSLTPGQAMACLGGLCGVCLLIGGFFWALGAPWVLAFAGLDVLALLLAFWAYARQAGDHETLILRHRVAGPCLQVLQQRAGRCSSVELPVSPGMLGPAGPAHALVCLRTAGPPLQLGRFLRPERRAEFRRALAWQLQQASRLPMAAAGPQSGDGPAGPGAALTPNLPVPVPPAQPRPAEAASH